MQKLFGNIWKWTLRTFAALCVLILIYMGAAEGLGQITVNRNFQPDPNGIEIFVLSNGVHTDIIVPAATAAIDWRTIFDPTTFNPPPAAEPAYVGFGWGDKNLYENVPTWDDLTVPIFVNSMFVPSTSTMRVTYYLNKPTATPMIRPVMISQAQYEILVAEIEAAFTYSATGQPENLNCCWYNSQSDNFYGSPKSYHVLRTCNNWTNRTLKRTGVPTALWTPMHDNILKHIPYEE